RSRSRGGRAAPWQDTGQDPRREEAGREEAEHHKGRRQEIVTLRISYGRGDDHSGVNWLSPEPPRAAARRNDDGGSTPDGQSSRVVLDSNIIVQDSRLDGCYSVRHACKDLLTSPGTAH